jgi:hypothetical protein
VTSLPLSEPARAFGVPAIVRPSYPEDIVRHMMKAQSKRGPIEGSS